MTISEPPRYVFPLVIATGIAAAVVLAYFIQITSAPTFGPAALAARAG